MLTLDDGRKELWQWDTGRKISADKECSQVHFSNKVFGRSFDVNVVDGIAKIPDVLLQTDKDLMVWAFVGTTENGYTKISKTFKINRRNKPADYVFTPPEQTSLEEIKGRIERLESIGGGGEDGFSPIVTVTQTDTGATISIQDKGGTTTATIANGKDGKDGSDATVTAENIEEALDYTPAKQTDVDKLYEEIVDLKENGVGGGSGSGLSATAKNLLITILKNAVYETDQSSNITALEVALANSSSGGESGDTTSGISQIGSILIIESDVTATQTGTVLAIA